MKPKSPCCRQGRSQILRYKMLKGRPQRKTRTLCGGWLWDYEAPKPLQSAGGGAKHHAIKHRKEDYSVGSHTLWVPAVGLRSPEALEVSRGRSQALHYKAQKGSLQHETCTLCGGQLWDYEAKKPLLSAGEGAKHRAIKHKKEDRSTGQAHCGGPAVGLRSPKALAVGRGRSQASRYKAQKGTPQRGTRAGCAQAKPVHASQSPEEAVLGHPLTSAEKRKR
ncbi:hypothetical protein NDU88_001706 [Pleurodeles waltl]|uniref:Uncharacterized protein n=1 Tax=Pleurodeles waltl TaxID=8319 RepID=A0AAV7MMA6_PLEWA|nr:hypothetical protein NDU88_001706 [Pleurodeles waltl]